MAFQVHLSNKSLIPVIFKVNNEERQCSSGFSVTYDVEECKFISVKAQNKGEAAGDFWIYEVDKEIHLICHKYGEELALHV